MHIRNATMADIEAIMHIYDEARAIMRANGNESQWINGYPARALIEEDIANGACYVAEGDDGAPHGVFMFAIGNDPTYDVIVDGSWLDDVPYGVIHRIGNDGRLRGLIPAALAYCLQRIRSIRIDTHADNAIMHHVLTKNGFSRCGTIYCQDGTPRVAYQIVK